MVNNAQQSYCFSSELENAYFQDFSSLLKLPAYSLPIYSSFFTASYFTEKPRALKFPFQSKANLSTPPQGPFLFHQKHLPSRKEISVSLSYIVPIGISIQTCSVFPYLSNNKNLGFSQFLHSLRSQVFILNFYSFITEPQELYQVQKSHLENLPSLK